MEWKSCVFLMVYQKKKKKNLNHKTKFGTVLLLIWIEFVQFIE